MTSQLSKQINIFKEYNDSENHTKIKRGACRKFYIIDHKSHSKPYGMEFLNEAEVFANGPPIIIIPPDLNKRGFRSYPVKPRFHLSKRHGRMPCDIERYGSYWLVSDKAKQALSRLCSANLVFMSLDIQVDPGKEEVKYWLCDIILLSDDLDIDKSDVKIRLNDKGEICIIKKPLMKLVFEDDKIDKCCVFRLNKNSSIVVCDDLFRDALCSSGVTGLQFKDAIKN